MQRLFVFMFLFLVFGFACDMVAHKKASAVRGQVEPQSRAWYPYINEKSNIRLQVPTVPHFFLSNGIRVDYIVDRSLPKVDFRLLIEGGRNSEETSAANQKGITSLWSQSLVLSGSQKLPRDALANYLELRASHFSSSVSLDRSYFSLASLSHFFEEDLQVVLPILAKPRLAKEDVDFVKKKILHSLQEREQRPATIAYATAQNRLWQNSARGRILVQKDIENLTQADVLAWQKKMWQADRMRILIAGDFDLKEITKTLEAFFKSVPQVPQPPKPNLEKANGSNNIFFVTKEIPQSTVLFVGKGIAHNSKDYYALKVFDYILGGGSFDSYLPQEIRTQRGWAYTVYSAHSTWKESGMIHIFTQTANQNVRNTVLEIEKILDNPTSYVNSTSVEKAKQALINRFVFLYSTPMELIFQKLDSEWDNLPTEFLNEFSHQISKVNLEEVLQVAKNYYQPQNFFVVVVGSESVKKDMTGIKFLIERKMKDFVFPR